MQNLLIQTVPSRYRPMVKCEIICAFLRSLVWVISLFCWADCHGIPELNAMGSQSMIVQVWWAPPRISQSLVIACSREIELVSHMTQSSHNNNDWRGGVHYLTWDGGGVANLVKSKWRSRPQWRLYILRTRSSATLHTCFFPVWLIQSDSINRHRTMAIFLTVQKGYQPDWKQLVNIECFMQSPLFKCAGTGRMSTWCVELRNQQANRKPLMQGQECFVAAWGSMKQTNSRQAVICP